MQTRYRIPRCICVTQVHAESRTSFSGFEDAEGTSRRSRRATRSIKAIGPIYIFSFTWPVPRNVSRQDRVPLWFLPLAGREAERAWILTNDAILRIGRVGGRNPGLRSLFRCGFQEQGIRWFGLPVRLFVRRGSQTEAIRPHMRASFFCHGRNLFVSIQRNLFSSKKKPTCRAASDGTPSRLSLPTILNFRYGRLVNCLLHTRRHSPIPKMYYRMRYSEDRYDRRHLGIIARYNSHKYHIFVWLCEEKDEVKLSEIRDFNFNF